MTALTAQNTHGVEGVHPVPPAFLRLQIKTVLGDIGADAVKTGMLVDAKTVDLVAELLRPTGLPIVVDPVLLAKHGTPLLAPNALATLTRVLLPMVTVLTPNVPEAELLAGMRIANLAAMQHAADVLLTLGVPAVLLKGGHMPGAMVTDLLATTDGITLFERPRLDTRHTHGTGCTLATAIAVGLAQGMSLQAAVQRAGDYVHAAIQAAPGLGWGRRAAAARRAVVMARCGLAWW